MPRPHTRSMARPNDQNDIELGQDDRRISLQGVSACPLAEATEDLTKEKFLELAQDGQMRDHLWELLIEFRSTIDYLTTALDNSKGRLETARTELKEAQDVNQALDCETHQKITQLEQALRTARQSTPSAVSTDGSSKKSSKMPDPEVFKTGTPEEWEVFKISLQDKLQYNDDHFQSTGAKVAYVRGRLGGEAQQIALPYSQEEDATPQSVLKALDMRFADPQAKKTARTSYMQLIQGNKSFPEFLGLFQRYAVRAGIPEAQQIDDLLEKCTPSIQQASFGFEFDSLRKLIEHLHRVVNQLNSYNMIQTRISNSNARRGGRGRGGSPALGQQPTRSSPNPGAAPAKANTSTSQQKPAASGPSKVECLNCRQEGHIMRDCSQSIQPGAYDRLRDFRARIASQNQYRPVAAVEVPAESVDQSSGNDSSALQSQ